MNVRTILLSVLLLAGIPLSGVAQAMWLVIIFGDKAATENFHFNIEGGLTISNIGDLNGKTMVGAAFGMGNYIKINERWSFVPEFKPLSLKGEKGLEGIVEIPPELEDADFYDFRLVMNYMEFPLLFRYEISPILFVAAGPQIGFRTSAKLISTAVLPGDKTEVRFTTNLRDETEWYDISLPVELGIHLAKESRNGGGMDLKFRWTPGLIDVAREPIGESEFLNNTFQILVSFPFLKKPDPEEE